MASAALKIEPGTKSPAKAATRQEDRTVVETPPRDFEAEAASMAGRPRRTSRAIRKPLGRCRNLHEARGRDDAAAEGDQCSA
jgi:hypothetical protein